MAVEADAGTASGGPGFRATALNPAITRPMLLFFIVGDILGGGIYALVGEVGDKVGGAIWTAFALAGVVAAIYPRRRAGNRGPTGPRTPAADTRTTVRMVAPWWAQAPIATIIT